MKRIGFVSSVACVVGLAATMAACAAPVDGGEGAPVDKSIVPGQDGKVATASVPYDPWAVCAGGRYPITYVLRLPNPESAKYGPNDGYTTWFPTEYATLKDQVSYEHLINNLQNHYNYEYLIQNIIAEPNGNGTYTMKGYADRDEHQFFVVGYYNWTQYQGLDNLIYTSLSPSTYGAYSSEYYGYSTWNFEPNVQAREVTCAIVLDGPAWGSALQVVARFPFADEHDPNRPPW
jgi:hypothetical protein